MAINTYDIASAKGADAVIFTFDQADVAQEFTFDSSGWGLYLDNNVSVDDVISPDVDTTTGLSMAGVWTGSVTTTHIVDPPTAYIRWTGTGSYTLQYTLNGTTWVNAVQGEFITLAGDEDFDIKVTFAGGILNDTSQVSSIRVYVLKTNTLISTRGRTITIDKIGLSETVGDQLNPRTDEGAVFNSGDSLDIPPAPLAAQSIKTIEFWMRSDSSSTTMYILEENAANRLAITSGTCSWPNGVFTLEFNGVAKATSFTVPINTWNHYRLVWATPTNNAIRMGKSSTGTNPASMALFGLAMYTDTPSNTYAYNIGLAAMRVDDVNLITVTEQSPAADIYAYAWSIISVTS